MQEITYIPHISIKPNYISAYDLPEIRLRRSTRQIENQVNLSETDHKGKISIKARRRIETAISWLLHTTERKRFYSARHKKHFYFKINFCTLTLASKQVHDDNTIKKVLLNQFLTEVRQKYGVKYYLWRAEPQKNKNIHFHIVMDKYIHYSEVRKMWIRIQDKLGYVERYTDQSGDIEPPCSEIKSVKKVKDLASYLAKYCVKESKIRKIQGKQWGLSYALSHLKSAVTVPTRAMQDEFLRLSKKFKHRLVKYDYATCLYIPVRQWSKYISNELYMLFKNYTEQVINAPPKLTPI